MRRLLGLSSLLLVLVVAQLPTVASAAPGPDLSAHPYAPGVVLVGFRSHASAAERAAALRSVGAASSRQLSPLAPDARYVRLGGGSSVSRAIAALEANPAVRYAEPDWIVTVDATSNDPYFTGGSLWGMYGDASSPANQYGSQAAEAWAAGETGSRTVYVGIIDTGIAYDHPDLAANAGNPAEPIDGVDNDGNGVVDDRYGYDFVNRDADPYDDHSHGTHVAGTIGGVGGNGVGVAGVNWSVGLLAGKFLSSSGSGTTSDAVLALDYFTKLKQGGLNIVATNNSWGGGGFSQGLLDAINRSGTAGILFIAAAGNGGSDGIGDNNDTTANYPSNYACTSGRAWDCVVAVASMTSSGTRSSFSNYGATTVDLAAPGSSIVSTVLNGTYGSKSGTSMATPHVTGAVALCASIGVTSPSAIRSAILSSTTATSAFATTTVSGGRLNVGDMAVACGATGTSDPVTTYTLSVSVSGSGSGYVTSSPTGISCGTGGRTSCTFDASGTVQLTATASTGSVLSGWTGCDSFSGTSCTVTMTAARTVTATFSPATYDLSVSVSKPTRTNPYVTVSTGGSVLATVPPTWTTTSPYVYGTVFTLVATTVTGATRVSWSGCSSVSLDGRTCTVTLTSTRTVSVTFRK